MKRILCKEVVPNLLIEFTGSENEIKQLAEKEHIYIKKIEEKTYSYYIIETENTRTTISENELPVYFIINNAKNFSIADSLETARECKGAVKFIDKPKRVFISGPMTGYKNYNFDTFNFYEDAFKKLEIACVNPVHIAKKYLHDLIAAKKEIDVNSAVFNAMIKEELDELSKCDTIFLLGGWEYSGGALKELATAIELKLNILQESQQIGYIFNKDKNKDISELI